MLVCPLFSPVSFSFFFVIFSSSHLLTSTSFLRFLPYLTMLSVTFPLVASTTKAIAYTVVTNQLTTAIVRGDVTATLIGEELFVVTTTKVLRTIYCVSLTSLSSLIHSPFHLLNVQLVPCSIWVCHCQCQQHPYVYQYWHNPHHRHHTTACTIAIIPHSCPYGLITGKNGSDSHFQCVRSVLLCSWRILLL